MQTNINQQNKPDTSEPVVDLLVATTLLFAGVGMVTILGWLFGGDETRHKPDRAQNADLSEEFDYEAILNKILKENML